MPANTPNRLYPYPVPADTTDIPGDLQRLAEAVDADLCDLTANIPVRPALRIRGTDAIAASTFDPLNTGEELPFDTIDFNTGLPFFANAGTVVNEGFVWSIRPQLPGFYERAVPAVEAAQATRSASSFLVSAIALAGLSPFGHTVAQFMIVWQR